MTSANTTTFPSGSTRAWRLKCSYWVVMVALIALAAAAADALHLAGSTGIFGASAYGVWIAPSLMLIGVAFFLRINDAGAPVWVRRFHRGGIFFPVLGATTLLSTQAAIPTPLFVAIALFGAFLACSGWLEYKRMLGYAEVTLPPLALLIISNSFAAALMSEGLSLGLSATLALAGVRKVVAANKDARD